jgi:hypothetical protein
MILNSPAAERQNRRFRMPSRKPPRPRLARSLAPIG